MRSVTMTQGSIKYPRKRISRGVIRALGKGLLPVLFDLSVHGEENYPEGGPLIVVGNHVAVMEAVLMAVMPPWQVEIMGSMEIPHERITHLAIQIYGTIPIYRGRVDRKGLRDALGVLKRGGVIGIFPEGGLWDPGAMRSQTGVSWLSAHSGAPVLPIGFGYTLGALQAALKLKRPKLNMTIGPVIAPLTLPKGKAKKRIYEAYAAQVLKEIRVLLPDDDPTRSVRYVDEDFALEIKIEDALGDEVQIPKEFEISTPKDLAKFFHRPAILKIFRENLNLPIGVLSNLDTVHNPEEFRAALHEVLDYLDHENPYLFTYRFGPKPADRMTTGLRELSALCEWAASEQYRVEIQPVWIFTDSRTGKEIRQRVQGNFSGWM